MIKDHLKEERLAITITISEEDDNTRIFLITPYGQQYEDLCEAVL